MGARNWTQYTQFRRAEKRLWASAACSWERNTFFLPRFAEFTVPVLVPVSERSVCVCGCVLAHSTRYDHGQTDRTGRGRERRGREKGSRERGRNDVPLSQAPIVGSRYMSGSSSMLDVAQPTYHYNAAQHSQHEMFGCQKKLYFLSPDEDEGGEKKTFFFYPFIIILHLFFLPRLSLSLSLSRINSVRRTNSLLFLWKYANFRQFPREGECVCATEASFPFLLSWAWNLGGGLHYLSSFFYFSSFPSSEQRAATYLHVTSTSTVRTVELGRKGA